jgi:radical SAM protein with 4Fe4S-binding SPASM domain
MQAIDWNFLKSRISDPDTPIAAWEAFFNDSEIRKHPAFELPEESVIAIPATARLRKDTTQVVFYGSELFDSWIIRLNSAQMVILSLFDGRNTLAVIEKQVAELSDSSYEAAWIKVRFLLSRLDYPRQARLVDLRARPETPIKIIDPIQYLTPDARPTTRLDHPVSLMIMPTDKCMTDCIYCYACRRPIPAHRLLTVSRIQDLIAEASRIGVTSINLDGGDILARKDHLAILECLAAYGMNSGISTKGYISKEHARQLHAVGVSWLQIGLDAPDDLVDNLVGRPGYFRKTIESIYNMVNAGITVRTNSIIVRESLPLLPRLIDILMDLPLMNIKVAPAFGSRYRGNPEMLLTAEMKKIFRSYMTEAEKKYEDQKSRINWECHDDVMDISREEAAARFRERPMCSSGRSQIVITPDGKVVTCEMSPQDEEFIVGDCSYQSIAEVWNSSRLQQWWRPARDRFMKTPCYDCDEFEGCIIQRGQCWYDAYIAYGSPYAPHPECPKAGPTSRRWE